MIVSRNIVIWCISAVLLSGTALIARVGASSEWYKEVNEPANGTYEIKAYSKDSLPLFKGILSSADPETMHFPLNLFPGIPEPVHSTRLRSR